MCWHPFVPGSVRRAMSAVTVSLLAGEQASQLPGSQSWAEGALAALLPDCPLLGAL